MIRISNNEVALGDNLNRFKEMLEPLTAILIKLSRKAETKTNAIIRLTWAIPIVTIVLLVVTIGLSTQDKKSINFESNSNQNQTFTKEQIATPQIIGIKPKPTTKLRNDTINKKQRIRTIY